MLLCDNSCHGNTVWVIAQNSQSTKAVQMLTLCPAAEKMENTCSSEYLSSTCDCRDGLLQTCFTSEVLLLIVSFG